MIDQLKKKGGREQLLMFVTGLAGCRKSTAIMVAQQFCFESCNAASIMWSNNTFHFTAYTGSAAAAFGGLTTSKATYLAKDNISDNDRKLIKGVCILIIDEVSFLTDSELMKLDQNLKKIGDSYKVFGGYTIMFSGDFQHLDQVGIKEWKKYGTPLHQGSSRVISTVQSSCVLCIILKTI